MKTRKGLHVYFQVESFPKRNGDKLDLLCEGAYAILPPSQDKQWLTPLNGNLSLIDPFSLGLEQFGINRPSMTSLSNQDFTEETEDTEDTDETDETEDIEDCEAICVSSVEFESLDVKVQCYVNTAITSTLPRKEGNRNRSIFRFCRWLKGHPAFEKLKAKALRPLVKMWYNQALPTIDTKIFDETWADFCYGWARVKYPKGNGMLKIAIQNALNSQQIIAAESLYEKQEIKLLVRICYELQKLQKDEPFWLAENDGAWILGVTRPTIGKWFSMLEADEVIKRVKKYTSTQATRYKFIGD